ncbi:unnamed protein product [Pleuronectes platessa]|uniref:Uncharacterized protein n=1 Tax=Pleuronectes platessa TaxID=8262 RepID=A0A9N7YBT8_PLEPL|nr:unnamed protein product [Pleuronectes platessa]
MAYINLYSYAHRHNLPQFLCVVVVCCGGRSKAPVPRHIRTRLSVPDVPQRCLQMFNSDDVIYTGMNRTHVPKPWSVLFRYAKEKPFSERPNEGRAGFWYSARYEFNAPLCSQIKKSRLKCVGWKLETSALFTDSALEQGTGAGATAAAGGCGLNQETPSKTRGQLHEPEEVLFTDMWFYL